MNIWKPGDPMEDIDMSLLDWVTNNIAISSYAAPQNPEILKLEKIRTVVSIGEIQPSLKDSGIIHVPFPFIKDATKFISSQDIAAVVRAIDEGVKRGKVLVHCAAGVSRSPGFVATYLAYTRGVSWQEALAIVRKGRPKTNVHALVSMRLQDWLAQNKR